MDVWFEICATHIFPIHYKRKYTIITMKFDLWVGCELVPKAGHSFKRGPLDQGEGAGAPRDFTHLEAVEQHKLDHLDPQTKK